MPQHQTTAQLDARGLNCPLPILRAKKAIAALTSGDILEIIATDPGSVNDFESFCQQTGNTLLDNHSSNDGFIFYIKKS